MNEEPYLKMKGVDCETSTNLGSPPLSCLKMFDEVPGCSYNSSVKDNNQSLHNSQIKEINTNINNLSTIDILEVLPKKPAKKDFYFYQAIDGQHIYLSAVNVEMLECMFGSLQNSPQQIKAIVIEKQYLSMTDATRKRYRFLLHLPITTVFEWVEIDLTNVVNQETLFIFKSNLDERKAIRDRRIRDEQRLAKRIEERSYKKQSLPPEWHNRDLFPECGYDPFSDKSMIPLSESIGITSTHDHTTMNISNGSPSSSNSLSFAKVLQNETTSNSSSLDKVTTNITPSQWPVLGGSSPQSISMINILEDTVANINLNGNHKSKNKKKKRSKFEPIL